MEQEDLRSPSAKAPGRPRSGRDIFWCRYVEYLHPESGYTLVQHQVFTLPSLYQYPPASTCPDSALCYGFVRVRHTHKLSPDIPEVSAHTSILHRETFEVLSSATTLSCSL